MEGDFVKFKNCFSLVALKQKQKFFFFLYFFLNYFFNNLALFFSLIFVLFLNFYTFHKRHRHYNIVKYENVSNNENLDNQAIKNFHLKNVKYSNSFFLIFASSFSLSFEPSFIIPFLSLKKNYLITSTGIKKYQHDTYTLSFMSQNKANKPILLPINNFLCTKSSIAETKMDAKSSSSFSSLIENNTNDDEDVSTFITTSDFKIGECIEMKGKPYMIVNFLNVSIARGSPFFRTKLKNLLDGGFVDVSFRSGEKIKYANVKKKDVIFSYKDDANELLVFQDKNTWEELTVKIKLIEETVRFLKEGISATLKVWNGIVIDIALPITVEYAVVKDGQLIHASQTNSGRKHVIVESGMQVVVPSYISIGDKIFVNTQTGEFVKKSN